CKSGVTIRMKVADIRELGRATQGVKLIRIDEGDEIAAITRIDVQDETGLVEETIDGEGIVPAAEGSELPGDTTETAETASEE
ncbi:MAG: hypothetical protein EOP50_07810, partial [Sphingobacteriales bacterium]